MKYAICNETFAGWEHARVCDFVADLGYGGLEVAPFTLAGRITEVSAERRAELRRDAEKAGVELIGLHWLLAKTEGFWLTSPDAEVRAATAEYLVELARACRDLGGSLLVLGSPAQRKIPPSHTADQASDFAADTLTRILPALERHQVVLCVEPLAPSETDFWQTAAEAEVMIRRLASPWVRLHLDVKAMSSEPRPVAETIRLHSEFLHHFHTNDANLRGPGFGSVDFRPILEALRQVGYEGWLSTEVFDYSPDPETIARQSIEYLRGIAARIERGRKEGD